MDNSEEIDSSEEKVSSVKVRINSSFRKPKQFSVHSFEQNGDQMESHRTSADVVQKKDKKEKKMMVVYLPVETPSGRSRSRRNQEGEHFQEESDVTSRLSQKEDQELCSTFEDSEGVPPGDVSNYKYLSSHSRMRSNPNLKMYTQKKENRPDPEGALPRRKHSFSNKSQTTPIGNSIRNTWSSLTESTPPIKILSMDSPTSPKRTSMNSLDITTPLQYSRHRSQQKSAPTAAKRMSSPIYRKSKHHFFPCTSQSSAEENRETSVTPTEPATSSNPYQSVLSFSFNVSDTDLDLSGNTKVIRMDVTPTRRVKSVHPISPKADEGVLIDVSDTAHKGSTINVKDDFESLSLAGVSLPTENHLLWFLDALVAGVFGEVVRAKGVLPCGGQWLRFDVVDRAWSVTGAEPPAEGEKDGALAVFIGPEVRRPWLRETLLPLVRDAVAAGHAEAALDDAVDYHGEHHHDHHGHEHHHDHHGNEHHHHE